MGPFFERLTNFVIKASREIKSKTDLSGGTVSVSYAAIVGLQERYGSDKFTLLQVGVGKIGKSLARNLKTYLPGAEVSLSNRSERKAGELANVLVYVVGGLPETDYPVPEEEVVITQQGCVYAPHVFGVRVGQTIRIKNPDGINHNVHMLPEVNRPMNKTMNAQRREITHKFREPEPPFSIKCDVHGWMQAYCAVFDHPFFAVSAKDGTYAIKDLPPGKYQLEAWHEHRRLDTQRIEVEVAADGVTTANIIFSPAKLN